MTTRGMLAMLGILYIAWYVALLLIARQAVLRDDAPVGARLVRLDYQRCVRVVPGQLIQSKRPDNRPQAVAGDIA